MSPAHGGADPFDAPLRHAASWSWAASSHPGKFGFVALHNILASGYAGHGHATNREGATILGVETVRLARRPARRPVRPRVRVHAGAANPELLRAVRRERGIAAAFVTSAGYGEAGEDGIAGRARARRARRRARHAARRGPTARASCPPRRRCARRSSRRTHPRGRIGIASQSGNFVSSFLNYSVQTGVGVSRAVSAGNAASGGVADYLDWLRAATPRPTCALAYVEGIADGRELFDGAARRRRAQARRRREGRRDRRRSRRARPRHTGSLASDDRVFDGMCRQAGVTRAATVEEAFEAAATFATQPLPAGTGRRGAHHRRRVGRGHRRRDRADVDLELAPLPDDLRAAIDEKLPPRWSRNNPVDLAGGETRDTIPEVLDAGRRATPRSTPSSTSASASSRTRPG